MITFGCPKGRLNFESKNPNDTKINGKSREVHEKSLSNKSLSLIKIEPSRENETTTKAANPKNIIWEILFAVSGFIFNL